MYTPLKPAVFLQIQCVPFRPWEDLALDFIMGVPNYHGLIVILVVVDQFSKGGPFWMLSANFIAFKVAKLFSTCMVCNVTPYFYYLYILSSLVSFWYILFE